MAQNGLDKTTIIYAVVLAVFGLGMSYLAWQFLHRRRRDDVDDLNGTEAEVFKLGCKEDDFAAPARDLPPCPVHSESGIPICITASNDTSSSPEFPKSGISVEHELILEETFTTSSWSFSMTETASLTQETTPGTSRGLPNTDCNSNGNQNGPRCHHDDVEDRPPPDLPSHTLRLSRSRAELLDLDCPASEGSANQLVIHSPFFLDLQRFPAGRHSHHRPGYTTPPRVSLMLPEDEDSFSSSQPLPPIGNAESLGGSEAGEGGGHEEKDQESLRSVVETACLAFNPLR